uniref:Uncharacterized protein n=1 Tax=Anguilla anguilla TaxID=7936 RepID=A0A0E9S912_ANGAN
MTAVANSVKRTWIV